MYRMGYTIRRRDGRHWGLGKCANEKEYATEMGAAAVYDIYADLNGIFRDEDAAVLRGLTRLIPRYRAE